LEGRPQTPSGVGLFIGGSGLRPLVFLFFGGAEYDDGFAFESRAAEKQKNK
jgi:hypothetical protein